MSCEGWIAMKIGLRFGDLSWSSRIVLVAGLILASASFWFPRESALHGAGGGTIGLVFLFFALSSRNNWFLALCSVAATSFCLAGGFGYFHLTGLGKVFSLLGAGCALATLLTYLADRSLSSRKGSVMKA